jgi:CRP-like cAMP-binding protein
MEKYKVEEREIFSLLTSKQVAEISDTAYIKDFDVWSTVYEQNEKAKNLFILLNGEVSLRIPEKKTMGFKKFAIEIDKVVRHGELFGTNLLFGVEKYLTTARATKPSQIMILDARNFLEIIRENKSEFVIMSYLAKVYFQRYINAMKELEECMEPDMLI